MKKPRSFLGLSALLACSLSMSAQGATLLTQLSDPARAAYGGTVGITFTVGNTDLSVTALGFQDAGNDGVLNGSHQVAIWNSAGTQIALATVSSGTSQSNYIYTALASAVTLIKGQTYTIGANTSGSDNWTDASTAAGVAISGDVTGGNSYYVSGGFSRPTSPGTPGDPLRWGPANMQYSLVPEPSAALLGGLGVLGLLRRRRLA